MSNLPEPVDIYNFPESQESYLDLGAEKKRIFLPVCRFTSQPLLVRDVTLHNEGEQITRLKRVNRQLDMAFPCPHSLVVFIDGGSNASENPSSAPLPWTVTFAPTSLHNRSGFLAPELPQTTLCAKQEALLRLLDFLRSADVDILWRKVIVAVPNEASMAGMVSWLDDDASNLNIRPAPNLLSEEGRTEYISLKLKAVWISRRLDVRFWLVPNAQMVEPGNAWAT